jgi:hypothetical protein
LENLENGKFGHADVLKTIQEFEKKELAEKEAKKKESLKAAEISKTSSVSESISVWTEEEVRLLSKAVARFPGGTQERWEKVSEFVKTKSVDEVMQKIKELKKSNRKPQSEVSPSVAQTPAAPMEPIVSEEWTSEQQAAFEAALRSVPKDHADRWEEISKLVDGKSKKDCIKRFKEIRSLLMKK